MDNQTERGEHIDCVGLASHSGCILQRAHADLHARACTHDGTIPRPETSDKHVYKSAKLAVTTADEHACMYVCALVSNRARMCLFPRTCRRRYGDAIRESDDPCRVDGIDRRPLHHATHKRVQQFAPCTLTGHSSKRCMHMCVASPIHYLC